MSFMKDLLDINGEKLTPEQAAARDTMIGELSVFINANPRCCRTSPDWQKKLHKLKFGALINRYKSTLLKEPPPH